MDSFADATFHRQALWTGIALHFPVAANTRLLTVNAMTSNNAKTSETSVLPAGTVESRGTGTQQSKSRTEIEEEIHDFLTGEAALSVTAESRAWFTVFIFITRLPGPSWVDLHPGYLMRGMAYFPSVGALIGVFVGAVLDLVALYVPVSVAACLSTAASFWLTGCFHEDGLADSSDGIGGGWSRSQILRIMTDTRLGTYGCASLILYVVTKLHLLTALGVSDWNVWHHMSGAGPGLLAAQTAARCTAPYLIRTNDYVDETGPKYKFYSFMVQAKLLVSWSRVGFAILFTLAVLSLLYGHIMAVEIVCLVLISGHFAGKYATHLLGGVMGDYLGATICVTELLVYLAILILSNTDMPRTWDAVWKYVLNVQYSDFDVSKLHVWCRFLLVMAIATFCSSFAGHLNLIADETATKCQIGEVEQSSMDAESTTLGKRGESNALTEQLSFRERYEAARAYIDTLAKPVGSLGTLEDWAARLVALQDSEHVVVDPVACLIFVADHGAAASDQVGGEHCSSFPQSVTRSIVEGLDRGIAGASVLARQNGVQKIRVVDVGVVGGVFESTSGVVVSSPQKLQGGTHNFCSGPAMTLAETERCLQIGRDELSFMVTSRPDVKVVVLGDVGIGNTTSSSALISHLSNAAIKEVCGGGATTTCVPDSGVIEKKIDIVTRALNMHRPILSPMEALAKVGGAEISALVGAILEASEQSVPILVDGFVVTTAALVAACLSPDSCRVMFLATKSVEPGQMAAIRTLKDIARSNDVLVPPDPIFDMGLRMGEATGALMAVPLMRSAAAMVNEMGTIADILSSSDKLH